MQDLHFRCLEGSKGSVIGELPSGMKKVASFYVSCEEYIYIYISRLLTVFPAKTTLPSRNRRKIPQPSSTISSISKGIEVKSEVSTARTTAEAKDARNAGGNS